MVLHDYVVSYEIDCDPAENSCFIGCEDEECTEEYFYAKIERHASDLESLCSGNVINCEFANICTYEELQCHIEYCSSGDCDEINTFNMENVSS